MDLRTELSNLNITKTGGVVNLSKRVPSVFRDYCFTSPLPLVASKLLCSDEVYLYFDHVIIKEPNTPKERTNWHNDQPYWPVQGEQVMPFWLPLDPVTKQKGALEFVKGSHKWPNNWFQPTGISGENYKNSQNFSSHVQMPDIEANRDSYDIVCCEMEPGDVVAFYALTLHGAGGNQTVESRRAYSVRYCGTDAKFFLGEGCLPFLTQANLKNGESVSNDKEMHPVVYRNIK